MRLFQISKGASCCGRSNSNQGGPAAAAAASAITVAFSLLERMSDDLVGCICSSLAGLMGAVRDAVASANGLSSVTDVLPTGSEAVTAAGSGGGDRGEQQEAGGLSPTQIASLILIVLAVFLSAFRSKHLLLAVRLVVVLLPHMLRVSLLCYCFLCAIFLDLFYPSALFRFCFTSCQGIEGFPVF